jgi:hypothetical protein
MGTFKQRIMDKLEEQQEIDEKLNMTWGTNITPVKKPTSFSPIGMIKHAFSKIRTNRQLNIAAKQHTSVAKQHMDHVNHYTNVAKMHPGGSEEHKQFSALAASHKTLADQHNGIASHFHSQRQV